MFIKSPCGNNIKIGGKQAKSYYKNGYIVVSGKLCIATQTTVNQYIKQHIKHNQLMELSIPLGCNKLYINAIHSMVPYPYLKHLVTIEFICNQFKLLQKRIPNTYKNGTELIFKYFDCDYDLIKITDYFTENERVKCSVKGHHSPIRQFKSKPFLLKLLGGRTSLSSSIIREALWRSTKECTLFKNTLVVDIIKYFNAKTYLDISAGWGDRLIGSLAANVDKYVGFDPNLKLKRGHREIQKQFDKRKVSKIHYIPFQDATLEPNTFDLVLSSPPYFDFENYANSSTQSMHTYNKLDSWLNNFLFVAIKKAWVALKPGGNMIIHIGDVNNYNIVSPMIKFMNKLDNSSNVMILGVGGNNRKIRKMYHICKRRS